MYRRLQHHESRLICIYREIPFTAILNLNPPSWNVYLLFIGLYIGMLTMDAPEFIIYSPEGFHCVYDCSCGDNKASRDDANRVEYRN